MLKLFADPGYWELTTEEKAKICNGAGPRGFGYLVPDTIWGLSVTAAADIHDWMYYVGTVENDKKRADKIFLNNMVRIIEDKTWFNWLRKLRCHRAEIYYKAVVKFGGPAFYR